jgi:hypothetical protein
MARAEFRSSICSLVLSHLSQGHKITTDGTLYARLGVYWDRQAETDGGSGRNGLPSLVLEMRACPVPILDDNCPAANVSRALALSQ